MPKSYNPTVFNECSDMIHDMVKLQGVAETFLCLERVVGTFLIEGNEEPTTPEDIQRVADCTRISDLLGKIRESAEVKRIDAQALQTEIDRKVEAAA
jgi:hypothetical protein